METSSLEGEAETTRHSILNLSVVTIFGHILTLVSLCCLACSVKL